MVHVLKYVLWMAHVVALLTAVVFQLQLSVHVTACQDFFPTRPLLYFSPIFLKRKPLFPLISTELGRRNTKSCVVQKRNKQTFTEVLLVYFQSQTNTLSVRSWCAATVGKGGFI